MKERRERECLITILATESILTKSKINLPKGIRKIGILRVDPNNARHNNLLQKIIPMHIYKLLEGVERITLRETLNDTLSK